MSKQIISTPNAPAAIGPYSQGVVVTGKLLFTAGQGPLDPATGKIVPGGIEEQTTRTLENLKAILEAAGTSFDKVVKANVYLSDITNFAATTGSDQFATNASIPSDVVGFTMFMKLLAPPPPSTTTGNQPRAVCLRTP